MAASSIFGGRRRERVFDLHFLMLWKIVEFVWALNIFLHKIWIVFIVLRNPGIPNCSELPKRARPNFPKNSIFFKILWLAGISSVRKALWNKLGFIVQ